MENKNTENISKRLKESRKEVAELQGELQRLISQGLNIHSPPKNQQEQLSNIKKTQKTQADEELIKIRDKVFNLRKEEEEKKFNFDEIVVGKQERKNEERNRRQELREYTRQQKEKRRQAAKVCDQQKINKELVQKNLDELNKKAKTLLAVNLQKRDRSRSKSPSKLNANTNVPDLIIPHFTQRSSACSTTRRSQTSRSQDRNLTTKDKEQIAQQEKTDIKNVKKPLSTINKNITVRQADVEDKDDTITAVDKLIQASIDKDKEKAEKLIQNQKSIDKETVEKIIQKSLNKDKDKVEKIIQTSLSLKEQKEKAEKIIQTTLLNELEDKKREEKIVQTSLCSNNERITKINNKSSNLNLNLNLNTMMPSDSYNIVNSVKRKLYSAINQYNQNNGMLKESGKGVDVGVQNSSSLHTPLKNSQELKDLIKRREINQFSHKSHSHLSEGKMKSSDKSDIKRDLKIIASSFQLERSGGSNNNNNKPLLRRPSEGELRKESNGGDSDTSKDALTEDLLSTDLDSIKSTVRTTTKPPPSQRQSNININFKRDCLQVPSNESLNLKLNLKATMPEYVYGAYDKIVSSSGPVINNSIKKHNQLSDNSEHEKKSSNHSSIKSIANSNSNSNINTGRGEEIHSENKELTLFKSNNKDESNSQSEKSFKTLNTATGTVVSTEEISDNIAAIPHSTSLSLATMSSHSTNTNNNNGKRKISESFKSLNTATKTQSEYESEQKSQTVSISERQQQQQEIDSSKAYSSNFISSATSSANVPSLKHPSVSLRSVRTSECVNVKETRIQEGNVHRLSLKAGEKTTLETKTNSNQIYLKFETELHLLNDFNESLRQFMEVEKSLLELHSKKLTAEEPAITQTIIPQQQNQQEQENEQQQELMILQKQNAQQNRILVKDAQTSMGSFKSASEPIITASKEDKLINKRKERQTHTRSMHPSINYSREEENSLIMDDLGSTSAFDTTNIEINSINFIEDCEKTIEATSNNSNISNTLESVVDLSSCKENILENNIQAGLSLKMFDYLIKEEDAKIENLKTILRIREKALLDRYKGELAWLNIQMRHYKETEQLQEMSVIKKRQRGLIIKLQHETQEMQRLKQVQKKASNERKTYLKQQQRMIKEHLSTNNSIPGNNVISKFKSKSSSLNSLKERPSIGPLKVYNVHHTTTTTTTAESSIKSETSIPNSKQQNSNSNSIIQEEIQVVNVNVTSVVQHTSSDGQNSDSVENEILTKSQRNLLVNTNTNSNATNSINSERNKLEVAKRTLLMHESVLQKRRQAAEELLIWHQRLLEEEKKVSELEMAASSIINQVHSPNVETLEKGKVHNFKGDQLNILWQNMTGRDEKKFKDNETYLFDQNALKKFCLDAKNCMNQEQTTTTTTTNQQIQIQQKTNQRPENVLITLTSNTNNNSAIQIPQLLPQQQQNQATNNKKEDLLTINSIKETIRYDMAINNLLNSSSSIKSTQTQDSSSIHHHSSISSKLTKSKSTPEIKEKEQDLKSKSTSEIKEKERDLTSKSTSEIKEQDLKSKTNSEIKEKKQDLKSRKSTSEIKEQDLKSKTNSEIKEKEQDSKSKKSTSSEIKEEDFKSSTKSIQTEKESKKSSDKSLTKENSSSIKLMNDEETINEEELKSSELSKDLSVRKSSSLLINDDLTNEDKNNKEFESKSKLSKEKQESIKLQSKSSLSDSLQINKEVASSSSLPKLNEELSINEVLSVKSQAKSSLSCSLSQVNDNEGEEEVPSSFSFPKLNEELSIDEVLSVKSQAKSSLSCSLYQVNDNEGEEDVPSSVSEELSSVIKSSNSNSSQELIKSKSVSEIEECANSKSAEITTTKASSSIVDEIDEKMSSSHHHQVNEEEGGSVQTLKSSLKIKSSLIDEDKLSKDKKSTNSSLSPHITEEFTKEGLRITEGNTSLRSSLIDEEELSKDKSVKSKSGLRQINEEFMKDGRITSSRSSLINEEELSKDKSVKSKSDLPQFTKDRRINEGNTSSRSSLIDEELSKDKSVKSKSDLPQITEEFMKDRRINEKFTKDRRINEGNTSSRSSLIDEEELSKDKSVKSKSSLPEIKNEEFMRDRRISELNTSSLSSLINEEVSKASLKSSFLQKSGHEKLSSPKIMKNEEEKTSSISSLIEEELSKVQKSSLKIGENDENEIPSNVSSSLSKDEKSAVKSKSSLSLLQGINDKNSLLTNKDGERTFVDDDEELIKEDLSTILRSKSSQIQEELTTNKDNSVEKSVKDVKSKSSLSLLEIHDKNSLQTSKDGERTSIDDDDEEELSKISDFGSSQIDEELTTNKSTKSFLLQGILEESRSKDSERTAVDDGNDKNKELSKKLGSLSSQINEELTTNKDSVEKSVKDVKSKSSLLQGIENEESRSKDSERTAVDDDGNDKNKELSKKLGSVSSKINEELTSNKDSVEKSVKDVNSKFSLLQGIENEESRSKDSERTAVDDDGNDKNKELSKKLGSVSSKINEELTSNKDSVEKSVKDVNSKFSLLQGIENEESRSKDSERTAVDDDGNDKNKELSKKLGSVSSKINEELTSNKDSVEKSVKDVNSKFSLLQAIENEESRSKDSERTAVDDDGNDKNKELSKKLGSVSSKINEELTSNKDSVEKSVKDVNSKFSLLQAIENEESRSKDSEGTVDDDGNDKNKELGSMSSQLIHEELTTTTSKDANVLLSIKKSNSDLKNSSPLLNEHSLSVKEVKESQESLLHSQTNQENLILSVKSKSQKKPEIAAENSIQSSLKEVKSSNSTSTLTLTENDLEKSLHVVVVKKEESKEHQEIDDEEVENSGQDTSISEQISLDSSSSTSHTSNSIHHQNNYNNKSEEDQSSSCYSSNNSNNKVIADGNCSIHRIQNQRRKEQQESNKNKPQVIERNEMMQHSISIFLNPKMHALNNATISQDQEKTIHQDLILSKKEEICRNIRNLKSSENQEIDDDEDVLSAINVDVDDGKLRKEENGNYSSSTFELEELDDEEEEEVEASSAKRRTLLRKNSHSSNSNSTSASVSSTENNSGLVKNVKKRVSEILAETQSPRAVDKSPRLQELYTTTYDVISPEHSPPPPKTESPPQVAGVHYVAKFGNEAEELFKIQLAIEQEIKQIEQQQKEQIPYMYMRDIPNKPPPPYTPPSSLQVTVPSVLPTTPEQIETIIENIIGILYTAHSNNSLENVTISEETIKFLINGNNIEKDSFLLVFNLCKEASIEHYKQFDQENHPIWMRTNTNLNLQKPLDKSGLEKMLKKQIKQLVGFEKTTIKENMIMKWSRKKRDHVDELLVNEAHNEESEWTNYDYDKHLVMQELTNDLMNTLINEATNDFTKILLKKGGYIL